LLPHDKSSKSLFLSGSVAVCETSRDHNGRLNFNLFNMPVLCADGCVRMSTVQPVFTTGIHGHLCAMDEKTDYGTTCPALCITRHIRGKRSPDEGDDGDWYSNRYPACRKCALPHKHEAFGNTPAEFTPEEEEE
jgi:hypothetical protein